MTNDLERRMYEHKKGTLEGFTSKYRVGSLLYYEVADNISDAIAREKQIKGWLRAKKIALIESMNAEWRDLAEDWLTSPPPGPSLRSG